MRAVKQIGGAALALAALLFLSPAAEAARSWGVGGTTLTCVDHDADGYGPGPGCTGPDADDDDASVNTVASWKTKYGTLDALLAKRGYTGILRYWFVDPVNGDNATCAPGTSAEAEAKPCKTFGHNLSAAVISRLRPGDAVVFRGGQTPPGTMLPQFKSGTAANPILLLGYPGEAFVLDRSNVGDGIAGNSVSHIIIDGFKIRSDSPWGNGLYLGFSRNITVRNMEMEGNYTNLRMMENVRDVLIERNVLHHSKGTENVYLGARGRPGENVTLRHNLIYHSSGLGSGYPAVQYNGRVTNYVVEGNIVYGSEQCFSWLMGVSNSVMRNNLCFGNAKALLTIYNYPGNQQPDCTCPANQICPYDQTGNVIENNTLVRPRYNRVGNPLSAAVVAPFVVSNVAHCKTGDLGHNTFRNNIVVGWGSFPLMHYWGPDEVAKGYIATSAYQNNLWYKPGAGEASANKVFRIGATEHTPETFAPFAGAFSGNIVADPLFVAHDEANWAIPENNDFHLRPESPARRAGNPSAPATDIQNLPQSRPATLGAYAN